MNASQMSSAGGFQEDKTVNPLDLSTADADLGRENYVCSAGKFENGKITCLVPELETFNPDNLSYYVDVALNGQQFTGKPLRFRYYDISITKISPAFVSSEGGTIMKIMGTGLYDSNSKRLRFTTDKGM